jgi:hypothetical protein
MRIRFPFGGWLFVRETLEVPRRPGLQLIKTYVYSINPEHT